MNVLRQVEIRNTIWAEFEEDGEKHWDMLTSGDNSCNCGFCSVIEEVISLRKEIEELKKK